MKTLFIEREVRKTLAAIVKTECVFEVRVLDGKLSSAYRTGTVSGYFNNSDDCVSELRKLTGAKGIYVTLNPVNPALLARRANRLAYAEKNATTSDQHILQRLWLLVDVDFDRPSGISAWDPEKEAAHKKALEIYDYLQERGWPRPLVADSGNGFHLSYSIDLPCDDDGLLEKVLAALADHFDGDGVKIDKSVHNPARIVRLYGTLAAKGDNTEERPHRLSRILKSPLRVAITAEQLCALVQELQPEEPEEPNARNNKPDKEQIRKMLAVIPKRPHYPDWYKIVAAVGDALDEQDAVEVLNEWSPEEEPGEYAAKLRSGFTEIHIGTLIRLAHEHGWTGDLRPHDDTTGLTSFSSLGAPEYPAPLEEAAYYGLAGEFVQRVLPETEADPAALLFQFLASFGNVIGRNAYMLADGARHYLNVYVVLVGATSKARKGTAWWHVRNIWQHIDAAWCQENIAHGLSSGEGLIWAVRDPIIKIGKDGEEVVDPGVGDKRLLVVEGEFASVLKVMTREGNTLSPIIRSAWDTGSLRTLVKHSPARATDAHISIIGHITRQELRRLLSETESANGFANRYCFCAAERSKSLPEGGDSYGIADLVEHLQKTVEFAKSCGELKRDDAARKFWAQVYPSLSEGKPGFLGAITARAEAQVLRFSGIYALLDLSNVVRVEHLALWDYSERSAQWIFETGTGNKNADRILAALRVAGQNGLTKEQIIGDELGVSRS